MIRKELFKGVNLNIIPNEKFKTNFLSVNFVVPLNRKTNHLMALMSKILVRGSEKYPCMASISKRLEDLYASEITPVYAKRAESLVVGFCADFIKDRYVTDKIDLLYEVTDLLFDIIFCPYLENGVFKEEYVKSEKYDLINLINSKINNKGAYAKEKCTEIMFGDFEYGYSEFGNVSDTEKATSEEIYKVYKETIETSPVEIFFNGDVNQTRLEEIIKSRFVQNTERKTAFPNRKFLEGCPEKITQKNEKMPVAQGKLVMGFRIGGVNINSENAAAFYLFNEIFGGSPSSKLFMNVREKLSLCYYCRSIPDMFMSCMFVSSGIETENKKKAYDAILMQLEDVKNGKFSQEDIEDAKRSLKNAYKEMDDSAQAECRWYLSRIIFGNNNTPSDMIEKIQSLTKDDVIKAAKSVCLDTVYFIEGTGSSEEAEMEA